MKRRKWKSWISSMLIASLMLTNVSYAGAWKQENGQWIYQDSGIKTTGWMKEAKENWYHFTSEGIMQTGWYEDEQKDHYYLNKAADGVEGLMRTGWFLEGGKWYFLNTMHDGFYGRAISGRWQWIDGYCYLFDDNGAMYADCITSDGYTVNADGKWTVNGVVQYQEGKGILTKIITGEKSKSGGSSGSSTGGDNSSGSNTPSEGDNEPSGGEDNKPSEGEDKPSGGENTPSEGEDKPSEGEDKPSGGEDIPSDEEDKPSGGEDKSGSIILKYMVQETGEILHEIEVSDRLEELYVIQYPAIEGYKLLPDQEKSARFKEELQEICIYYRPIKEGETPDESVVLRDNVKGILSNTETEKKVVEQIAEDFFDINLDDEENLEWAVYNTNPIYNYIQDGTVESGDILYIAPSEQFPMGFIFTYYEHNDTYTGTYANYDANSYEVLHGKKTNVFEMLGPGTSFSIKPEENNTTVRHAFSWDPWNEEQIVVDNALARTGGMMQRIGLTGGGKLSVPIKYNTEKKDILEEDDDVDKEDNGTQTENGNSNGNKDNNAQTKNGNNSSDKDDNTQEGSGSDSGDKDDNTQTGSEENGSDKLTFKPHVDAEAYADVNININIPLKKIKETKVYVSFTPGFKGEASCDISGKDDVGKKILDKLSKKLNKEIPKQTKLSLAFFNINIQGIDLTDRLILRFDGWNIITKMQESNMNNIISDEFSVWDLSDALYLIVPVMVRLSAEIEGNVGINATANLEYPVIYDNTEKEPLKLGPSTKDISAGATVNLKGNIDLGAGAGAGLAVAGSIPVLLDLMPLGATVSGEADGTIELYPKQEFHGYAAIEGSLYSKISGQLKLAFISGEDTDKEKAKPKPELSINEKIAPDLGQGNNGIYQWASFSYQIPEISKTTLELNNATELIAVDKKGKDISSKFSGYDKETGTIKVVSNGSRYSFECPRYYQEKGQNDDSKIFEIESIVSRVRSLDLDLTKAEGVKNLISPVYGLQLSSGSESLETICTSYLGMLTGCSKDCENAYPIPDEFKGVIGSGTYGYMEGELNFSKFPNLKTFWVDVRNVEQINLSKNSKLENVGIITHGNSTNSFELKLPSSNEIKALMINTRLGEKLAAPIDLSNFTNLECAEIAYQDNKTETSIDVTKSKKLKHLYVNMKYMTEIDLSKNPLLKRLNLSGTSIEHLDISNNLELKTMGKSATDTDADVKWMESLRIFTGNGKVFPTLPQSYLIRGITWYRDAGLTEKAEDGQCGQGETLYRSDYKDSSASSISLFEEEKLESDTRKATASDAVSKTLNKQDDANDVRENPKESSNVNKKPQQNADTSADKIATSSNLLQDSESKIKSVAFADASVRTAVSSASSSESSCPFPQTKLEYHLFGLPEDNRSWKLKKI